MNTEVAKLKAIEQVQKTLAAEYKRTAFELQEANKGLKDAYVLRESSYLVEIETLKAELDEVRRERNYLRQYVERLAAGVPIPDTPSSILSALPEGVRLNNKLYIAFPKYDGDHSTLYIESQDHDGYFPFSYDPEVDTKEDLLRLINDVNDTDVPYASVDSLPSKALPFYMTEEGE